ncbi:MAG TPA: DUF2505 family protein [Kofleriaceae bacterium]|nr:DUF2505 family protein [Kofleriaceae bacterium]
MTPFCFEHTFAAPSPAAVLAAYFDANHQLEQDRAIDIAERELVEFVDDGTTIRRVSRVVPRRQLPAFLRRLSSGPLHYLEVAWWNRDRAPNEIRIEIRPSLMGGRAQICATYHLEVVAPNTIRRRYTGHVSVDVALVRARVERGIVAEFERSVPIAASCTQSWLDRHSPTSVTAQA